MSSLCVCYSQLSFDQGISRPPYRADDLTRFTFYARKVRHLRLQVDYSEFSAYPSMLSVLRCFRAPGIALLPNLKKLSVEDLFPGYYPERTQWRSSLTILDVVPSGLEELSVSYPPFDHSDAENGDITLTLSYIQRACPHLQNLILQSYTHVSHILSGFVYLSSLEIRLEHPEDYPSGRYGNVYIDEAQREATIFKSIVSLPHLKRLIWSPVDSMVYTLRDMASTCTSAVFFPVLEELRLTMAWHMHIMADIISHIQSPSLSTLYIENGYGNSGTLEDCLNLLAAAATHSNLRSFTLHPPTYTCAPPEGYPIAILDAFKQLRKLREVCMEDCMSVEAVTEESILELTSRWPELEKLKISCRSEHDASSALPLPFLISLAINHPRLKWIMLPTNCADIPKVEPEDAALQHSRRSPVHFCFESIPGMDVGSRAEAFDIAEYISAILPYTTCSSRSAVGYWGMISDLIPLLNRVRKSARKQAD